jgi:hypothetical protein
MFNSKYTPRTGLAVQYLTKLTAQITINNHCYFAMLLLHVSAPISHFQGDHSQGNVFTIHAV